MSTTAEQNNSINVPDANGHFGIHGGRFVSETLMGALEELEALYERLSKDLESHGILKECMRP